MKDKVEEKMYQAIMGNGSDSVGACAKVCEDVAVGFLEWYMTMCRDDKIKLDLTTYEEYYSHYVQNILYHE